LFWNGNMTVLPNLIQFHSTIDADHLNGCKTASRATWPHPFWSSDHPDFYGWGITVR
jgi:hypothetical protein